tara:strand:+ start:1724 stop:2323 length:600 start_codon:yes stop_codon:yes gene_type:complete
MDQKYMSNIGYARVSTKKQGSSLDSQIQSLKKHGCDKIYSEAVSGANIKRKELTKAIDNLKSGDNLIVVSIDRMGRSIKDLINIITHLNENEIGFTSLKEHMNTTTDVGMLLFNMLCSVAEFERKLINRRIYDGVKKAHEDGKYKGRQYGTEEPIRREFVEKMKSGNYTVSYLAKMAKISRNTLYKWKNDFEKEAKNSL